MISIEEIVMKVKPKLEIFLRTGTIQSLKAFEQELFTLNCSQLQIVHTQVLMPLILKLEKIDGTNNELQTGIIDCIRVLASKLFFKDVTGLKTMLIILLMQIRDCKSGIIRPNLSEEIKLATVQCISEILQRSTSDVLEQYYTKEAAMILGQLLLTLVNFISTERYRKLKISSLNCLMTVFYVHDNADFQDTVLRSQVADTLFIFLPKIVTVLFTTSLYDEKHGETLITTSVKALGRILCLIFEENKDISSKEVFDSNAFRELIKQRGLCDVPLSDGEILAMRNPKDKLEERLEKLQREGRSSLWFGASSRKLKSMFSQIGSLRSHQYVKVRQEYANMCCTLLEKCSNNLKENFVTILESTIALTEDEDYQIKNLCAKYVQRLQESDMLSINVFDENAETLFDEHLTKLPRIIHRCDNDEQYAEFLFLKGFLRSLNNDRLERFFTFPQNLDKFCTCLVSAFELKLTRDLLIEEYSLREIYDNDSSTHKSLPWRLYKNLNSEKTIQILYDICGVIGNSPTACGIVFDYFINMLTLNNEMLNEIILIMTAIVSKIDNISELRRTKLIKVLMDEAIDEKHWNLSLQADDMSRLKVEKNTYWFVDRTPGLYESAMEIRKQDYDSDDEDMENDDISQLVTISDAQFNVLHTCIILDAIGHCAMVLGELFNSYVFKTLHKVLLKAANCNYMVNMSASFALFSIRKSLGFSKIGDLIDAHSDYITYHLNTILKKSLDSKSAVDILTVVLQYNSVDTLGHLEDIFSTIREECSKNYKSLDIISFLRVFHVFLLNVVKWKENNKQNIDKMQVDESKDEISNDDQNHFEHWMDILKSAQFTDDNCEYNIENELQPETNETNENESIQEESSLPRYIQLVKDILEQVLKFLTSSVQMHQIVGLECLITGIPLLEEYEDELLPIVHLIWQPLVERFKQKDPIVLNRCFTLFETLAIYAKDFILKESLAELVPSLCKFLSESSLHSQEEVALAQTQEFKLQFKLLQEFSNLVINMRINGKALSQISESVSLYLSNRQPKPLQANALLYFRNLIAYNGPFVYLVMLKLSHINNFQENVNQILSCFGIRNKAEGF